MLRLTPPASSQAPSTALENGGLLGSATPHHGHELATGTTGALQRWQEVADLLPDGGRARPHGPAVGTTATGPRTLPERSATTSGTARTTPASLPTGSGVDAVVAEP